MSSTAAGLMRQMGLQAIWQKPNTSKPNPEHKIFPYLLRGMTIDGPTKSGRRTSPTVRLVPDGPGCI